MKNGFASSSKETVKGCVGGRGKREKRTDTHNVAYYYVICDTLKISSQRRRQTTEKFDQHRNAKTLVELERKETVEVENDGRK